MNQRSLPFEKAEHREALIQGLPVEPRLQKLLRFLDQWGRRMGMADSRYVLAAPPRADVLEAVGVSTANKRVWQLLRDQAKRLTFVEVEESNHRPTMFRIDWLGLVDASSWDGQEEIAARAAEGVQKRREGGELAPPVAPPSRRRGGGEDRRNCTPPAALPVPGGERGRTPARAVLDYGSLYSNSKHKDPSVHSQPAPGAPCTAPAADRRRGGFWARHVLERELSDPDGLLRLFEIAAGQGKFSRTYQAQLEFFAIAHFARRWWHDHRRRMEKDVVALFTSFVTGAYLARQKFAKPIGDQLDERDFNWARLALEGLGLGPQRQPDRVAGNPLVQALGSAFSVAAERKLSIDEQLDRLEAMERRQKR